MLKVTTRGAVVAIILGSAAATGIAHLPVTPATSHTVTVKPKGDWTIASCALWAKDPGVRLPAYTMPDRCYTSTGKILGVAGHVIPTAENIAQMHAMNR